MPENHAFLSPSASKLWLASPACWYEEAPVRTDVEQSFFDRFYPSSSAAAEGTLGHEIVEKILRTELKHERYYKEHQKSRLFKDIRASEHYSYYLQRLADWCVNQVHEILDEYDGMVDAFYLEKEVHAESIHPELWGTSDVVIVAGDVLHIVDFKFGRLPIHAQDNPQLKIYAYAALDTLGIFDRIKTVRGTILQPRDYDRDDMELTSRKLHRWGQKTVKPAAIATAEHTGEMKPSISTCRYCKHRVTDKKHRDEFIKVLGGWDKIGIRPSALDKREIIQIAENAAALKQWVDDVVKYATAQVYDGQELEGLKLVKGASRRQFTDEKRVRRKLKRLGYNADEYLKPRPLKPLTEIEALVGHTAFERDFARSVIKNEYAPRLVPLSNKGLPAANKLEQAADDFAAFTE
ncbi:hypothetical protein [Lactococcus phage 1358]|uniref:Phage protein n=1 Tax=Lactococcus phage 1358 TaxID=741942 RepID=D3W0F7_9CAUD|nr:exonuclease [Lactococcus phage 1358]ADD25723.1 hypothetical protein [Lactococcus phage 1358]